MKRERFKSILLVFLIIMNFVLASKILIEKKLWPDGYNFFSDMGSFELSKIYTSLKFYFAGEDSYKTQVLSPQRIIINTGDQTTRISLNSSDAEFAQIWKTSSDILKDAFEAKEEDLYKIKKEDLYSALAAESVHMDFQVKYDTDMFAGLIGESDSVLSKQIKTFSDIVIVHSPRISVYIADTENDRYIKINTYKNSDELVKNIEKCMNEKYSQDANVINYSFDLKFDKPFGTQKTTLNPLIQIYSDVKEENVIEAKNPVFDENGNANEVIIEEILKVFGMNMNAMNRYTEAGGTLVFVENDAILKIGKDGLLDYEATENGIRVSNGTSGYSEFVKTADLVSKVNIAAGNAVKMALSDNENEEKDAVVFDYLVRGLPVLMKNDNIMHGAEAVIENGYIKKYTHLIRNYTVLDEKVMPSEFLSALDNVIANYSEFMKEIYIKKMYMGYVDDGTDSVKTAEWIVNVDNVIAND